MLAITCLLWAKCIAFRLAFGSLAQKLYHRNLFVGLPLFAISAISVVMYTLGGRHKWVVLWGLVASIVLANISAAPASALVNSYLDEAGRAAGLAYCNTLTNMSTVLLLWVVDATLDAGWGHNQVWICLGGISLVGGVLSVSLPDYENHFRYNK